ncbi:MAG TPA: LamG domain-containing protein [Kofleriaceae bacterium]|nr:LamG domain-containing protein [Kofleriaceae bacterium]
MRPSIVATLILASACTPPEPRYEQGASSVLAIGTEQELSVAPIGSANADPAIAFGNGHYLAAWRDDRDSTTSQSVGTSLFTQTSLLHERLLEDATPSTDPPAVAVAAASTSYLVVTNQRVGKQDHVRGQIVDLAGNPFGSSFLIDQADKLDNAPQPTVAVASDGNSYLVLWGDKPELDIARIFGARFTADGNVVTPQTTVIADGRNPAVAFDGTSYLVVYQRTTSATLTDIFARRVLASGVATGAEIQIAATANRDEGYAVACSPAVCVVTWRTGTAIRAMRIAADGTILDPGGDVVGAVGGTVRLTTTAFDGTDFVIAWRTASELRMSRLAPDGTLVESDALLVAPPTAPENATLASDGAGQLAVVYDRIDELQNVRRVKVVRTIPPGGGADAGPDAAIDAAVDAGADAPDAPTDGGGVPGSDPGLSDATNGGTTGFYLLAPLVEPPATFPGAFDGSFGPRLTITVHDVDCQHQGSVGGIVQTFPSVLAYPATEQYKVSFSISSATYVSGNCYRVIPRLDGAPLGYRDVQALPTGSSFVALPGYKKWGIGANTTIAFRLEAMDPDGDGLLSHVDNCDLVANPDQTNHDGDALGDVCDIDDDNDGVVDGSDNCVLVPNADQANHDADASGDACDADDDNDGVLDGTDNCPLVANASQTDSDGDGIGDACDVAACAAVPGAIGAWPGDNSAEDIIGTAEGTFTGTPSFAPAIVGPAGCQFTGANSVRANAFDYAGAFTVSFWAKANVVQGVNTGLVASAEAVTSDADLANTFQVDWDGTGRYRMRLGGTGTKLALDIGAASTTTFQHVVVTYDGSIARTFLDGRGVSSGAWTGPALVFTALRLGVNRGGSAFYKGVIDDVHVFSRALSLAEIAAIFNARADGICP